VLIVSLLVAALAVARVTRFLTDDFLAEGYRRWMVNYYGDQSKMAYLAHCPWCTSVWVAALVMPPAVLWPNQWVIMAYSIPAASMLSGLFIDRKE
jgi:Protein of unknown function (DUF1360).